MKKLIVAVAISLMIGFAAAGWLDARRVAIDFEPVDSPAANLAPFDESAPVEQRLRALEKVVDEERQARETLAKDLLVLREDIERRDEGKAQAEAQQVSDMDARREAFRARRFGAGATEGEVDRLVAAGFPIGRAEWIVQREAELQMEVLQSRYESMQRNEEQRFFGLAPDNGLRDELGETDYERYLTANGRATAVDVGNVISGSPAEEAGLQSGDRIVRYDGRRVFSMMDVAAQVMQGRAGGSVVVDIERDGTPMQLVMPRGPLGVMGN